MKSPALALIMGKGGSKGPPAPDDALSSPDEEAPDSEGGGDAKQYARLAAEALADNDIDGAADSLESLARAVK